MITNSPTYMFILKKLTFVSLCVTFWGILEEKTPHTSPF